MAVKKIKAKPRKFEEPEDDKRKEPKFTGPWNRVIANALHSKNYKGRINLGTYVKIEDAQERESVVIAEGYQQVEIIPVMRPDW